MKYGISYSPGLYLIALWWGNTVHYIIKTNKLYYRKRNPSYTLDEFAEHNIFIGITNNL